jgi:hypothetical protein
VSLLKFQVQIKSALYLDGRPTAENGTTVTNITLFISTTKFRQNWYSIIVGETYIQRLPLYHTFILMSSTDYLM